MPGVLVDPKAEVKQITTPGVVGTAPRIAPADVFRDMGGIA